MWRGGSGSYWQSCTATARGGLSCGWMCEHDRGCSACKRAGQLSASYHHVPKQRVVNITAQMDGPTPAGVIRSRKVGTWHAFFHCISYE